MSKKTGMKTVEDLKGTLSTILSETVHRSFFNVPSSSPDNSLTFVSKIVHRAAEDISELMQSIREWEADERSKHRDEDDFSIQSRVHQKVDSYLESFFAEKRASTNSSPELVDVTKLDEGPQRPTGVRPPYFCDTDTSLSQILLSDIAPNPVATSSPEERKPAPVLPSMSVVFNEESQNPSFRLNFFTQVPSTQDTNNHCTDAPGQWTNPGVDSVPDISRLKLLSDDDTETFNTECYEEQQHLDSYAAPPPFFMPEMLTSILVKPIQDILKTSVDSPEGGTEEEIPTGYLVGDINSSLSSLERSSPDQKSIRETVVKLHSDPVPPSDPVHSSGVNLVLNGDIAPVSGTDDVSKSKVSHVGAGEPLLFSPLPGEEVDSSPGDLLKPVEEINQFFRHVDQESPEALSPCEDPDQTAQAVVEKYIWKKLGAMESEPSPFKVQQWDERSTCLEENLEEKPVTETLNLVMKDFFHGLSEQQLNKMSRGINSILLRDQLIDMCLEMLRVSMQTISSNKSRD
ncbi:uncharacterized protein ACB058_000393 [Synchiropus picturatus]